MSQMTEPVIQLLKGKNFAYLSTLMNDGSPQVTPTWIDLEDSGTILIPTVEGRIKHKNVSRDPRVAICISDENNPYKDYSLIHIRSCKVNYHINCTFKNSYFTLCLL